MVIIELKDCNILNIYNSFTDGYYEVSFFDDEAENAIRNFLPWVLKNKDNFKEKIHELAVEEL